MQVLMCGIIAYTGAQPAAGILLQGLSRLEYRGYDSAGLCIWDGDCLQVRKKEGRISILTDFVGSHPAPGCCGISHTRWATHGAPTDANAHPHADASGKLCLVHNGVIENYSQIKARLVEKGHAFLSQTDSEVLAHLIGEKFASKDPTKAESLRLALMEALGEVSGTYGIALMHADFPGLLLGARRGSPLVVGIGQGEHFLASDVAPVVNYTREVIYLNDFDVVEITPSSHKVYSLVSQQAPFTVSKVEWDAQAAEKGDFPHYMLKEIFEQPTSVENVLRGRLDMANSTAKFGGLGMDHKALHEVSRVFITACGTALHAGKAGEYVIEDLARLPVETDFASEFRYRNSPLDQNTLVFVVSQSGETADTLAAMREVKSQGFKAYGICNVVGSTIARESDGGIFLHAGPEIGVAATKSFTSQAVVFTLLALLMGRNRGMSAFAGREVLEALQNLPRDIGRILETTDEIRKVAEKYAGAKSMLFLGRQANYPIAMEGALKLKEISYIHAEAYPSAELKHGVIALVSPELPTVVICPKDAVYEKNLSTIQEVKARKGPVIAVATEGDDHIAEVADDVIYVPRTHNAVQPILNAIPLQLFAYHIAVLLGCDVDKPRNLAKSVTVE